MTYDVDQSVIISPGFMRSLIYFNAHIMLTMKVVVVDQKQKASQQWGAPRRRVEDRGPLKEAPFT